MQTALIVILVVMIAWAALSYYLGWVNPPRALAWHSQAAFVLLTFVLIPATLIVLWLQSGAEERLAAIGVTPHPSIESAIGVATGLGDEPVWLFSASVPPDSLTAFYRAPEHREGWQLASIEPLMIVLERNGLKLAISGYEGWTGRTVSYVVSRESSE